MLVDGPAEAVLDLQLRVVSVGLELAALVDVPVGRRERYGEEADDEEVAQEPEVRGDLKGEMTHLPSASFVCFLTHVVRVTPEVGDYVKVEKSRLKRMKVLSLTLEHDRLVMMD